MLKPFNGPTIASDLHGGSGPTRAPAAPTATQIAAEQSARQARSAAVAGATQRRAGLPTNPAFGRYGNGKK
jgi:hypothetical protein